MMFADAESFVDCRLRRVLLLQLLVQHPQALLLPLILLREQVDLGLELLFFSR